MKRAVRYWGIPQRTSPASPRMLLHACPANDVHYRHAACPPQTVLMSVRAPAPQSVTSRCTKPTPSPSPTPGQPEHAVRRHLFTIVRLYSVFRMHSSTS